MTESTEDPEKKKIPPPPDDNATPEEWAAYFEKYDLDELEEAGYSTQVFPGDPDYPIFENVGNSSGALWQLSITFTLDEMSKLESCAEKAKISVETLAKQWIFEQYQVEIAQTSQSD
jgi:Fe-S cluster biosynthesis and repair protein YggX